MDPRSRANAQDFVGTELAVNARDLPRALAAALLRGPIEPPPDGLPALVAELSALAGPPAPESSPRPWAAPLAPLQRLGLAVRRRRTKGRASVPVIAIGSSSARGSGKTSTALWVAEGLAARGHRVGVATRGVGRTGWSLGSSMRHGPDADWLGDEGALFALRGYVVAAHADRWRAVDALADCSVILLEDGLQCSGVAVDFRIATVDARYPAGRGPFPAGEAREPFAQADLTIAHHVDGRFPAPAGALRAERRAGVWNRPLDGPICAFAGIARPADFFAGLPVGTPVRSFADHHRYSASDVQDLLAWAGGRSLATTDRDQVRLPSWLRDRVHARGVAIDVPGFPWDAVLSAKARDGRTDA
jgi:tetraacyldisaccharide 4'-kinase